MTAGGHGPARALAVALGSALAVLPLLTIPAAAADPPMTTAIRAADEKAAVRVVIDGLQPLVPADGDDLRVTGRVVSAAAVAISDVSVQLRRSSAPLTSRRQVTAVASAPVDPGGGDPDDVPLPSTRVEVAKALAPGASAGFTIRVPISALGLPGPGTYVLGIEAVGRQPGVDEFDARQGVLRTFLPWYPDGTADVRPVDVTWLWPLADWPARAPDGVLIGDRTPVELSEGGRLDTLMRLGRRHEDTVSWIADPALLQTAQAMTDGYQVQSGGQVVVGDREQQAQDWLAQAGEVAGEVGMRLLPYADIDASAVTRAGMSNDVVRAVTVAPAVAREALGGSVGDGLYWAPFGRIDRPALDVLASAGVGTIVLSADALPTVDADAVTEGQGVAALPTAVGTIRAVLTDPTLSAILAGPQRTASDVLVARQLFLAQTAVLSQGLPADSPRSVVVAPADVRWTATASLIAPLLKATRTAPWLSSQSLTGLLEQPLAGAARKRGAYGEKARDAELAPGYLARVAEQTDELDVLTSVVDDPTGIGEPFAQALLRAESAAWRTEPDTAERLLGTIARQLSDLTERVHVLSTGNVTLSGDTGRVPVTIVNDLDRAVTVGLALVGHPSLRIDAAPLEGIEIDAGKMVSVDVDAKVVGGDPLDVDVQLLAPDGAPFGQPAPIVVSSTAYARAAAWVVAASFVAVAVFVVFGVTRRIRSSRRPRGPRAGGAAGAAS